MGMKAVQWTCSRTPEPGLTRIRHSYLHHRDRVKQVLFRELHDCKVSLVYTDLVWLYLRNKDFFAYVNHARIRSWNQTVRVKFLTQGNEGSFEWWSNSRMTDNVSATANQTVYLGIFKNFKTMELLSLTSTEVWHAHVLVIKHYTYKVPFSCLKHCWGSLRYEIFLVDRLPDRPSVSWLHYTINSLIHFVEVVINVDVNVVHRCHCNS